MQSIHTNSATTHRNAAALLNAMGTAEQEATITLDALEALEAALAYHKTANEETLAELKRPDVADDRRIGLEMYLRKGKMMVGALWEKINVMRRRYESDVACYMMYCEQYEVLLKEGEEREEEDV